MHREDRTILVVDDQPRNLKVLITFLKEHSFQIRVAISGEQALKYMEKEVPDLILLDVMMPGIDGFETCRQIKGNPQTAALPILFMTALDSVTDKVAGFEAGGADYITKPFQQMEVLARVNAHMTIRKQQQELLQQKKLMQKMSITDDLTGLYNRRHLNTHLIREFEHCKRYKTALSCIMLDLDHFKQVNDSHGHEFGDEVLRSVSALIKESVRSSDYVFRFGGEEFVVLLPETKKEGAMRTAEKIRSTIAAAHIQNSQRTISIRVTISGGVATFQAGDEYAANNLINLADKALYTAKETGRNRIVFLEQTNKQTNKQN